MKTSWALLVDHICAILVHTDLEISDALKALDQPVASAVALRSLEQKILHNVLERCPLCDHWTWIAPTYWNRAKGCCTRCGEQED